MRVTSLKLLNFRAFGDMQTIGFGPMNVFVGPNNSGKTSILQALALMQDGLGAAPNDVRLLHLLSHIEIGITDARGVSAWNAAGDVGNGVLVADLQTSIQRNQLGTS